MKYDLDPSSEASLRDPRIEDEVLKRIRSKLKDFPVYAKIRRVVLLLEPWTIDNGLLTPTLEGQAPEGFGVFTQAVASPYGDGLV